MPTALAIARTVQCVASWRGGSSVSATTLSTSDGASGAIPGGRVLSRSRPSTPSAMKRSCQRHTHVFDLPVAAMIATVPMPSAVSRMIRARQTCFCGDPRAATSASSRALSDAVTTMLIPLRIPHRRTAAPRRESSTGLVCPDQSTRG